MSGDRHPHPIHGVVSTKKIIQDDSYCTIGGTKTADLQKNRANIELFRKKYRGITEWYFYSVVYPWIKLASTGETVYPLNSPHKVPTERLLFFSSPNQKPIRRKNIFSIASSVHSRKPQIYKILESEFQSETPLKFLELFARNLHSGWLSIGNDPLFSQNKNFYTMTHNSDDIIKKWMSLIGSLNISSERVMTRE